MRAEKGLSVAEIALQYNDSYNPLILTFANNTLISMINTSILSIFPLRFAEKNMVSSVSGIADFATYLGAGIGLAVYGFWNDNGNFIPMFASWIVICVLSILLLLPQRPFQKGSAA